MKRWVLAFILIFFVAVPAAHALNWHTANQATVAWDATTTLADGTPIPAGDAVEYTVYLANAITDPGKINPSEIATVATTEYTITLNAEGSFYVGLQSIRLVDSVEVSASAIIWSDDPAVVQGGATFGIRYFLSPAAPSGLRPQ